MSNFIVQLSAVILSGLAVGVADALIKKTASAGNFWPAFRNPLMLAIFALYLLQIALFVYAFTHSWKLGIAGNIQIVAYSATLVLLGFLLFHETLSLTQIAGIVLALISVVLMNL